MSSQTTASIIHKNEIVFFIFHPATMILFTKEIPSKITKNLFTYSIGNALWRFSQILQERKLLSSVLKTNHGKHGTVHCKPSVQLKPYCTSACFSAKTQNNWNMELYARQFLFKNFRCNFLIWDAFSKSIVDSILLIGFDTQSKFGRGCLRVWVGTRFSVKALLSQRIASLFM